MEVSSYTLFRGFLFETTETPWWNIVDRKVRTERDVLQWDTFILKSEAHAGVLNFHMHDEMTTYDASGGRSWDVDTILF